MKRIWRQLAITALRALRPYFRFDAEQERAYQIFLAALESL